MPAPYHTARNVTDCSDPLFGNVACGRLRHPTSCFSFVQAALPEIEARIWSSIGAIIARGIQGCDGLTVTSEQPRSRARLIRTNAEKAEKGHHFRIMERISDIPLSPPPEQHPKCIAGWRFDHWCAGSCSLPGAVSATENCRQGRTLSSCPVQRRSSQHRPARLKMSSTTTLHTSDAPIKYV